MRCGVFTKGIRRDGTISRSWDLCTPCADWVKETIGPRVEPKS